jgi:hypothetical protein
MSIAEFETTSVRMEMHVLLCFQAPIEDVDRIMEHVVKIAPLAMGHYDSNAFEAAPGVERYRPLEGAAAGAETGLRKRPGIAEVSFQLPMNQTLLEQVIEEIFQVSSYQEPNITVSEILASRSKGRDDKSNPHRWWNTTGDWKKA